MTGTSRTPGIETSGLAPAAHIYAEFGWPVFPLASRQKVPLLRNPHPVGSPERKTCRGYAECGQFGHGVLDATTDHDVIDRWWTRTPAAGIGMACGRGAPDVVDVDVKKGVPGLESRERLRRAGLLSGCIAQVETPSGGEHLYFEGTTQGNGSIPKAGIDFRSLGGYVVIPPTPIWMAAEADEPARIRAYQWLVPCRLDTGNVADWAAIRQLLTPPAMFPTREPGRVYRQHGVAGLERWVLRQGTGNRNNALYWACRKALEGGQGADALEVLAAASRTCGLDEGGIRKSIRSAQLACGVPVGDL
jgi:hypothetical protein